MLQGLHPIDAEGHDVAIENPAVVEPVGRHEEHAWHAVLEQQRPCGRKALCITVVECEQSSVSRQFRTLEACGFELLIGNQAEIVFQIHQVPFKLRLRFVPVEVPDMWQVFIGYDMVEQGQTTTPKERLIGPQRDQAQRAGNSPLGVRFRTHSLGPAKAGSLPAAVPYHLLLTHVASGY